MSIHAVIGFVFVFIVWMVAGAVFAYVIGTCTRCGHWSMGYVCPNCKRGRYDYRD